MIVNVEILDAAIDDYMGKVSTCFDIVPRDTLQSILAIDDVDIIVYLLTPSISHIQSTDISTSTLDIDMASRHSVDYHHGLIAMYEHIDDIVTTHDDDDSVMPA